MKSGSKVNLQLESLRGFAAIFVVLGHIVFHNKNFDSGFFLQKLSFLFNWKTAHLSVLIFFILSGYVIGASNKVNLKGTMVLVYLKKRLLRLYPIYFLSVILALLVATNHYSTSTVISNFAFTQGILTNVIWENNPIWSLNYELLYYMLFIPVSIFNINPLIVCLSSLFIAFVGNHLYPDVPVFASYFYGFSFWAIGLCIAKYLNMRKEDVNFNQLLAVLFYTLSLTALLENSILIKHINYLINKVTIMYPLNAYWPTSMIPVNDLLLVPYCFAIVMIFSGNYFKYKNYLLIVLQVPVIFGIVQIVKHNQADIVSIFCVGYFVISILLYFINSDLSTVISQSVIKAGTWLGSISYAIYVIHYPILFAFGRMTFLNSHNSILFLTKVFIYLSIVLFFSYLLEKKYQPAIKNLIDRPDR